MASFFIIIRGVMNKSLRTCSAKFTNAVTARSAAHVAVLAASLATLSIESSSYGASLSIDCSPSLGRLEALAENDDSLLRLKQQARAGNANAKSCLAELYLLGWGVKANDSKAWVLLHQAVQDGSARAMHRIGSMYEIGTYIPKNRQRAFEWHLRSANLGHAPAQSDVGIFLEDGLAGERSIEKALYWYRKAARHGEPFAIEALQRLGDTDSYRKDP